MPAKTAAPGDLALRSPRNSSDGLATSRRPLSRHLEHADLVGRAEAVLDRAQDAEMMAAFALEIEHGVDHVLDDARAGDLAVLGDVADEDDGRAASAWRSGSSPARRRAPASPCPAPIRRGRVHSVWIESMITRSGRLPSASVARMSSTLVSAASTTSVSAAPQPLGAQPHLRHRLFAGDVDDAAAPARQAPPPPASAASTCRCPGSPPISIAEPRTKPPPVARSSSAMPRGDARRFLDLAGQRRSAPRRGPCVGRLAAARRRCRRSRSSSTIVFHSPQASHLPAQRVGRRRSSGR